MGRIVGFAFSLCISALGYAAMRHFAPEVDPMAMLRDDFVKPMAEIAKVLTSR